MGQKALQKSFATSHGKKTFAKNQFDGKIDVAKERRCILSNLEKFTSFLAGKWWRHLAYFKARIQLQAKFQVPLEKSTFPSAGFEPGTFRL